MKKSKFFNSPLVETESINIFKKSGIPVSDIHPKKHDDSNSGKKHNLEAVIGKQREMAADAVGIKQLLPEVMLVREIIVPSILSPTDLQRPRLDIYLDGENVPRLVEAIRKHFTTVYNLESKMSDILGKALFDNGSVPMMTISPKIIHNLIQSNSSYKLDLEARGVKSMLGTNLGILDLPEQNGFESVDLLSIDNKQQPGKASTGCGITITDNFFSICQGPINEAAGKIRRKEILGKMLDMESIGGADNDSIASLLERKITEVKNLVDIHGESTPNEKELNKEKKKKGYDEVEKALNEINPIVYMLPAESVINVHVPGEPSESVGFYVAKDSKGYPLSGSHDASMFKDLNRRIEQATKSNQNSEWSSVEAMFSSETKSSLDGTRNSVEPLVEEYERIIDSKLKHAVEEGTIGRTVEVAYPESILRLMFARQLEGMKTEFVFVPAELMTYVAFNFDGNGTGLSLIEQNKMYASMRAMLVFARTLGAIKNSQGIKKLNIVLDEYDPDKLGTIENAIHEICRSSLGSVPWASLDPADIINGISAAGLEVAIEGGETFPGMEITMDDSGLDIELPDEDLMNDQKRSWLSGYGINPEVVDRVLEGDFATGIKEGNLLQSKRLINWGSTYCVLLADFIQKYTRAGGPLLQEIKDIIREEKVDSDLADVINSIRVRLPEADPTGLEQKVATFEAYREMVDVALESYISEEGLGDIMDGDDITSLVDSVRISTRNHLIRQYISKENLIPELAAIFYGEDGIKDTSEGILDYNKPLITYIRDIIKGTRKVSMKEDAKLDKWVAALEEKIEASLAEPEEEEEPTTDEGDPDGGEVETTTDEGDEDEPPAEEEEGEDEPPAEEESGDEDDLGFDPPGIQ